MAKKKKKDNHRPRKPKSDLEAKMPRPRPITIHGARYYIEHAREYPIFGSWIMKGWQDSGITPVVLAHIRHNETEYDSLLASGYDRYEARMEVADAVARVLAQWKPPE